MPKPNDKDTKAAELERLASAPQRGILREFWSFLTRNSRWWLLPVLVAMLLVGVLVVISSSGAGPFIYALF